MGEFIAAPFVFLNKKKLKKMIKPTKIVLNRQSDLILTSPEITTPIGINAADIYDVTKSQDLQTTVDSEISRSLVAESSLEAKQVAELSTETLNRENAVTAEVSYRVSGDLSLQNQIDFITSNVAPEAIDSLTEIVTAFQNADGDINGAITTLADAAGANLSTEVARATSAEGILTNDLSTEVSNRIADVDAEESRATAAELVLTNNLSSEASARIADVDVEESRAIAAEGSLAADLATETYDRNVQKNALEVALSTEVSNRAADVDSEESRAIAAEGVLTSDLSAEVSTRKEVVNAEESRAIAAEGSIAAKLSQELLDRADKIAQEASLRTVAVDSEMSRAKAAELTLTNDLSTEASRAVGVENYISSQLINEASRAIDAEGSLATDLSSEIVNRGTAVDAEASYRVSGDQSLQNQIDFITSNVDAAAIDSLTEIVSAFQSADGDINGAITTLSSTATSGLSTEVARAESVEESLAAAKLNLAGGTMSGDIDMGSNNITELNAVRTDEVSNRDGDIGFYWDNGNANFFNINQLKGLVDAPTDGTDATNKLYVDNADASIATDLSAEASRATAAEGVLTSDLSTEVSAREAAISAEESNREAAMSDEESMRVEADASIAAELASEIGGLADVDGLTIELNGDDNTIRLMENVGAPVSGVRTFEGLIDVAAQPSDDGNFNDLSLVTKKFVVDADVSIASDLSAEISARMDSENQLIADISDLALVDGTTIDVNPFDNTIRLMEDVAAPDSGIRTFEGLINVGAQPSENGNFGDLSLVTKQYVDAADADLGVRIDSAIANTDFSQIDSISEVIELYNQKVGYTYINGDNFVDGDSSTWIITLNYYFKDNSEAIYLNGLLLEDNDEDYSVIDNVITFSNTLNLKPTDKVIVYCVTNIQSDQFSI